jgi:hypothetical protein
MFQNTCFIAYLLIILPMWEPFQGPAHPLDKSKIISYFEQKVGNFPFTMGYWTGRIWLILAGCNQACRLRE